MPTLNNAGESRITFELPPAEGGEGRFVRVGSKHDAKVPKGLPPTVQIEGGAAKHIQSTRVFKAMEGRDGLSLR